MLWYSVLAVSGVVAYSTVILPSRSDALLRGLSLGRELPGIGLPKVGTLVHMPVTDFFGRKITISRDQKIIAMPSCQSCLLHRLNPVALCADRSQTKILCFPEKPPQAWYKNLKQSNMRAIWDRAGTVLPSASYLFAPTTVTCDITGRIVSANASSDL